MAQDGEGERDGLAAAAARVYAVPPAEFMATRSALVAEARAAKDRDLAGRIGKLRKPSNAAAIVNALVRAHPELVEQLASVGAQMRAAQANLHATALTALRPARDRLLADVATAAAAVASGAGLSWTAAVDAEIRDTMIAALADAEATAAVTSGALTRALHYSGFGEVDLADAVVATATGRLLRVIRPLPGEETPGDTQGAGAPDVDSPSSDDPDATPGTDAAGSADDLEGPGGGDPDTAPGAHSAKAGEDEPEEDPEALLEQAAAAYQQAAATVVAAKRAVSEGSARLDEAKARVESLRSDLAAAEQELEELFASDAQAREVVAAAVKARAAAAEALAAREAALDEA